MQHLEPMLTRNLASQETVRSKGSASLITDQISSIHWPSLSRRAICCCSVHLILGKHFRKVTCHEFVPGFCFGHRGLRGKHNCFIFIIKSF